MFYCHALLGFASAKLWLGGGCLLVFVGEIVIRSNCLSKMRPNKLKNYLIIKGYFRLCIFSIQLLRNLLFGNNGSFNFY